MGSGRGCPFARRPPKSGGMPGACSAFWQLDGLSCCVQSADHSDTWKRCSGRLHDAFGSNMWSSSTKSSAYDQ